MASSISPTWRLDSCPSTYTPSSSPEGSESICPSCAFRVVKVLRIRNTRIPIQNSSWEHSLSYLSNQLAHQQNPYRLCSGWYQDKCPSLRGRYPHSNSTATSCLSYKRCSSSNHLFWRKEKWIIQSLSVLPHHQESILPSELCKSIWVYLGWSI